MSLLATRLQNFRDNSPLDKWETRASRWGALDLFMNQTASPTGVITESLQQKAVASVGSTLEIPVINGDAGVSVTNTVIPLVITGSPSTSALYQINFINYFFGFKIHPAAHFNNEISMQREFETQMTKHTYKLMDLLDLQCLNTLESLKSAILKDNLGGRYSISGDTVQVPFLERDAFVGDIGILMAGNDYFGPIDIVGNGSFESHVRNRLLEKGQFNSEDKTYQWADKTYHFTNNLSNPAGNRAALFAVIQDSVGLLQQFAPDCVLGNQTHNHAWGIETLPIANLRMGTYEYDGAVDGSLLHGAASSHLKATKEEAYGFHSAFAFVTPYNSDAANTPTSALKLTLNNEV